jgi:protease-4
LLALLLLASTWAGVFAQEKATEEKKPETNKNAPADENDEKTQPEEKRQKVRFALFKLEGALSENSGQAGLFGDTQSDLRKLVEHLDKAAKDKTVAGAVLDIRNPDVGPGKVEEIRAAITRFRASGKKVYAQLESAMPADYLIACACDEIIVPESGDIILPGIHAEATFYKGLFGKLGIEADFVHIGAYKGAAEPLTQEKFSEPVRENLTAMVDSMYDDLVTTIVKHRPLSVAQAKDVIDRGMITASKAKQLGLVDRVAYPNALREELAKRHNAEPLVYVENYGQQAVDTDFSGPTGILKLMQAMMGGESKSAAPRGKKIAIIYATGAIVTGESAGDLFGDQIMGSSTIVEALRKANNDKQVVAIVLRIDSPGGSALASDLIWHETQVIEKPIVASMGDVAASGGYYIAMGADKIIAAPGTVTGSIGVVGGKLAVKGLLDKIGVTVETIQRGKNSSLFALSGKFTESERQVVQETMEDVYRQFTTKAAAGRKMPLEKLQQLAGGRVYTGRQAKEIGLVDELGTLHDAITAAKLLAGLEKDAAVRLEVLPEPMSILDALFETAEGEKEVRLGKSLGALAPELLSTARKAQRLRAVFDRPAALVMPFELEIR